MKNRFLLFVSFLFILDIAYGQDITRRNADSMISVLNKSKPGVDHIGMFLDLAEFHMFKPGEFKNDLDSATDYINRARQLNAVLKSQEDEGHILMEESFLANEYKDRVKAKQLLDQAILILEKGKNNYLKGRAYMSLADYFSLNNQAEVPDRMRAFINAIAAFNAGGYIEKEAYAYKMLAESDSSDVTAEVSLTKSLALYNSINYQELQGVYDLFCVIYIIRSDFPQALKWGLKALKTAETVGDSSMQFCTISNHVGIIYQHSRDSANAIKYYTVSLRTAEKHNDKNAIYLLAHNISAIYFNLQQPLPARDLLQHIQKKYGLPGKHDAMTLYRFVGDLLNVYTLLKQFQLAEQYCRQLIDIENENNFLDGDLSDAYVRILDYFLASGQYTRMLPYLKKDEQVAKAYGNPRNMARLHALWFSYDTSQHNYRSAIDHLLQNNAVTTIINSQARDRAIKELQIQFETSKKEDQIALLNKQSQLEKANLKQATQAKNMTIAGTVAALIIAGLLYRQSRLRKKNNTVITHKNEQLQHFLTEKEWLLKEIHHRVKNNLQIVMSLLNSQSAYIDNEPALTAIHDSQHRVHAMSLIHQKLYNTDNVSSIDMSLYIRELVSYLADCFNTGQRIRFELAVEPLEMDVSQAVPLGLILNEAITNSIKYAFPNDREGVIKIALSNTSDSQYLLEISDNGIGIPSHSNNKRAGSLGMSLMAGLSEDLDGSLSIENNNGAIIRILFVRRKGGISF